ncbi:MAG: hypothetical protein AAF519_07850 [Bacteroidota bacterium]
MTLRKSKKFSALLALAFLWWHRIGEEKNREQPIRIKKHGKRNNDIFRYGLDYLRKLISPLNN